MMNRFVRWIAVLITLGGGSVAALAQTGAIQGYCDQGGVSAMVSGLPSTNKLQGNIPSCTITVFFTGTTTQVPSNQVFKDGSGTPLGNPFTADARTSLLPGHFLFFVAINQAYDVTGKGGIAPNVYPQTVPLLTDVFPGAAGGGGSGCTLGSVANNAVLANHGGACFGDQFFTYHSGVVDINGGASLLMETGSNAEVDGVNDPTHNNWFWTGDHLTEVSNGANNFLGGINLSINDGSCTTCSTGPVPILLNYTESRAGKSAIGMQVSGHVGGIAAGRITGIEVDGPVNQGGSATTVWGYLASMGADTLATVEQFSFLAETQTSGTPNANYCDFLGRVNTGATRESLGCGPTGANTFNGPTTFQNITINGTCTGSGCGGGGGSGNTTSTALTTNTLPVANGPNSIVDSIVSQSADRSTLNINGTGPGCISLSASQICVTAPPYNASNAGTTTTTTSGTFAVGTSGTIASCSTFGAGNGVLITGAGAAGANYVGKVVTCTGTTLTVTPATSTSVATSTVVQHDESAAFQAAITALATTGGQIFVASGRYLVNGPLQDTSHANAVLLMPSVTVGPTPPVAISIEGYQLPAIDIANNGTIIQTSLPSGNLIGGSNTGGSFPPLTSIWLDLKNITFRSYANPGLTVVNASALSALHANHIWCDTGPSFPDPSNTAGACIRMPALLNNVSNYLDDVTSVGYYTGFVLTEHTHAGSIYAATCHDAFVFDTGANAAAPGTYIGNSISVDYLWSIVCHNGVTGGANQTTVNIQNADVELPIDFDISDPGNKLRGLINIANPYAPQNITKNGAALVNVVNLNDPPPIVAGACTITGSIFKVIDGVSVQIPTCSGTAAPLENWLANETSGTNIANTADTGNPATATAVTRGTTAGFPGSIAQYNGTSSFAVAANSTNTNFTGATPFSGSTWIFATAIVSGVGYRLMSTWDTSTSLVPGWALQLVGSTSAPANVELALTSNISSNLFEVFAPTSVTANAIHNVCFTYDGSKTAAGVHIYVDGVSQTLTTGANSLTGSIASGVPVMLGANKQGASQTGFFQGSMGYSRIYSSVISCPAIFAAGPI